MVKTNGEDSNLKIKKAISWAVFILIAIWIGFFAYVYFNDKMLDYRMNECLRDFFDSYSSHGLIYEYDVSCKEIFSDYGNSKYCETLVEKDFCYFSFASFSDDESLENSICSNLTDSRFCSNF